MMLNQSLQSQGEFIEVFQNKLGQVVELARFYRDGILSVSQGRLFYNDKPLDLLNSPLTDGMGLQVSNLVVDKNDFYLLTDIGVFENYRRIFTKEPCYHLEKTRSKIFISCQSGIYTAAINKKDSVQEYLWQIDPQSPQQVVFFTLNVSQSKIEFAASANGFYWYNSRAHQWMNRAQYSMKGFADVFSFGRFYVSATPAKIYLPTANGIFVSSDKAVTWTQENQGLKANSQGFFEAREIKVWDDKLILATANGIYVSSLQSPLDWQLLSVTGAKLSDDYNHNVYSIDVDEDSRALLSNSQGQIFTSIQLQPAIEGHVVKYQDQLPDTFKTILKLEPSIQELHRVAIEFAGIPTGRLFDRYKRQARLRNLLPTFTASVDRDSRNVLELQTQGQDNFSSSNLTTSYDENNLNRDDKNISAGLRLDWKLGNLVYDSEINDINTSARITANVRENILTEVTQIYYNRKALLFELLKQQCADLDIFKQQLQFEEYTAQIDARTGAWFSEQLESRLLNKLDEVFTEDVAEKIRIIYGG